MDPRISVVVPVYNAASTVARAISSIQSQTLKDWELLLIDDGSTDASPEILRDAARADARLRVLARAHEGIVAALNAGLAAARGALIARMDGDDESFPDRLSFQKAFLDSHSEIGVVGAQVDLAESSTANNGYRCYVRWLNSLVSPEDIERSRFIESPLAHPSVMFRRELIVRHGGYRGGEFPEDYELWLRWLEAGVRMAKLPVVLLRWHDQSHRLSRTDPRYAPAAFFRLKAPFLARWLQDGRLGRRQLLVWGAGRLTRRRADLLEMAGVRIDGFLDIDPRKQGRRRDGRRVLAPQDLPPPDESFVVGYVASRGARDLQRGFLESRGYVEGRDFVFAA